MEFGTITAAKKVDKNDELALLKNNNGQGTKTTGCLAYSTIPMTNGYSPSPAPSGCRDITAAA